MVSRAVIALVALDVAAAVEGFSRLATVVTLAVAAIVGGVALWGRR
jgi:hypothetical protein